MEQAEQISVDIALKRAATVLVISQTAEVAFDVTKRQAKDIIRQGARSQNFKWTFGQLRNLTLYV